MVSLFFVAVTFIEFAAVLVLKERNSNKQYPKGLVRNALATIQPIPIPLSPMYGDDVPDTKVDRLLSKIDRYTCIIYLFAYTIFNMIYFSVYLI